MKDYGRTFPTGAAAGKVLTSDADGDATWEAGGSSIVRSARTSNAILAAADKGSLIDVTSGTFTQTIDSAANLGSDWWCHYKNSGTGIVSWSDYLDATELITNGTADSFGANVVLNGAFDHDDHWTKGAGWTISGNKAVATAATGNLTPAVYPLTALTIYKITFDAVVTTGTFQINIGGLNLPTISSTNSYTQYGWTGNTEFFIDPVATFTGSITNLTFQPLTTWLVGSSSAQTMISNGSAFLATAYARTSYSTALRQTISALTIGALYELTYTITRSAGSIQASFGNDVQKLTERSVDGTYTERFLATMAHTQINFLEKTAAFTGTIDTISLKRVLGILDGGEFVMLYPGMTFIIQCTGTAFFTVGRPIPGSLVKLISSTIASAATAEFSGVFTRTFDDYVIVGRNVKPATDDVSLLMNLYDTPHGWTDSCQYIVESTSTTTWAASAGTNANCLIAGSSSIAGIGNDTTEDGVTFTLKIFNAITQGRHYMQWVHTYLNAAAVAVGGNGNAVSSNADDLVEAVRFLFYSGNIASGTIEVYGVAK